MNKKAIGLVLLLALGLSSCRFGEASVNYTDQKEERKLTGVTSLKIEPGDMDVKLVPAADDTLKVSIWIDRMTVEDLSIGDLDELESPFDFSQENGKLTLSPVYSDKVKESAGQIEVQVPAGVQDVQVNTLKGNIYAESLLVRRLELVSRQGTVTDAGCTGTQEVHIGEK